MPQSSVVQARVNQIVSEKKRSIENALISDRESNKGQDHSFFSVLDSFYGDTENADNFVSKRIDTANIIFSNTGYQYQPTNSRTKTVNGCNACTTLSEVVVRSCESYGQLQDFVSLSESEDCNNTIFTAIADPVKNLVYQAINTASFQSISVNTQTCISSPLYKLMAQEIIKPESLCQCTAVNVVAEATYNMKQSIGYTTDYITLYGDTTNAPQWDGIKPDSNTTLVTGVNNSNLYAKLVEGVTKAITKSKCDPSSLAILVSPEARVIIASMVDSQNRPLYDQATACVNLGIGCVRINTNNAIKYQLVSGNYNTDIFIGNWKFYAMKKYIANQISDIYDYTTGDYRMQYVQYGIGKIMKNNFVVLSATF